MLFKAKANGKLAKPDTPALPALSLPDRAHCLRELQASLAQKKPKGGVLLLYLENFKQFNDAFGHDFGELFLSQIVAFLETVPQSRIMRCGGATFLLLLEGSGFTASARTAAVVQERFEGVWRIGGMDYMCAVRLALACYPEAGLAARELLGQLEFAVSEAAHKPQNALVICNDDLRRQIARRAAIAALIPTALETGAIDLRYRPTIDTESGRFARAECYLRLFSPTFGMIGLPEFVPVAVDSGQICAVQSYAIEAVCRDIRRLIDAQVSFESLAVPLSPVQFLQESFPDELRTLLERYDIPRGKLAFELSENALTLSFRRIGIVMRELCDLGVELIINGFGTGRSGLGETLALPVDVLKLEQALVWQMETSPRSGVLIEGLVGIANRLGLKIIAEGIETDRQAELLRQCDCRYQQGFYYSAPVSPDGLLELLGKTADEMQAAVPLP